MWFDRLVQGAIDTLLMVGVSSLIALLVGIPLAVFLVTSDKGGIYQAPALNRVLGAFVNLFRSIPFLILMVALIPFTRLIVGTTYEDIVSNPKKIKILQVEAVQLVRAYDDADLVQGYPAYIRLSKTFDAESALLFDGLDHPEYVIQFVIQPKSKTDPRVIKFVDIYQHSPVVRAALDKSLGKLYQVGWEDKK